MNILIVDDDPDDRELFCEALRQVAPHAVCFPLASAQECIDHLRQASPLPDFVFLDIQMNHIDGKECLLRIKRTKSIERVQVVIYSSLLNGQQEILLYRKLGANHVMEKPGSFSALCDQLRLLLSK